jgi:transposase
MLHYAGIDWATKTHAVCVVDQAGQIRARFQVPNTGKSFTGLIKRLGKLGVAGVAIERPDGPLVEAMLAADLRVVVVTPRQVTSLRSRYRASGAKSDPADAYLLADVLRTDGHRLAALTPDSDPTKILRALSRTRKDLVEARVALVNQLTSQLEGCFPGAIGLFHELHSPVAVAFLRRYPTSHAAATLTQATLAALLRRLHYSGRQARHRAAPPPADRPAAGISPVEAAGRAVCVLALLEAIQVTSRQERELEAEIVERLGGPRRPAHLHLPAPSRPRGPGGRAAGRAWRRARPLPRRGLPGRPGRGRAGHHHLGQTPGGQVPLGLRQEAAGGVDRLRR